jgi:hypothetical protein
MQIEQAKIRAFLYIRGSEEDRHPSTQCGGKTTTDVGGNEYAIPPTRAAEPKRNLRQRRNPSVPFPHPL